MSDQYEVVIAGSGLAGACAAALLARHSGLPPERIALLAGEAPRQPERQAKPALRVVALSRASERVLAAAQAWQRLPAARLCNYERMRVWHESADPFGPSALCFEAAEIGEPNLGYIAEADVLQWACLESFRDAGGVLIESQLQTIGIDASAAHVQLTDGRSLNARLLIGADGAHSLVRAQVALPVQRQAFGQQALVATVHTAQPHRHTAWQRFLHTGPLALLPLFDGSCSVVWSIDRPQAVPLVECDAEQFCERLDQASALVLGRTQLASERRCFTLQSLAAQSYMVSRCALIGDAAHVIHPLAGQGANLGLLDAAALCEALRAGLARREDPGALRVLRSYEQQRRTHNLMMDAAMRVFHHGFALRAPPATWLLNRGLGLVNRSGALKRAFARAALGESELPELARIPTR